MSMNMQQLEQQLYDIYGIDYIPWWRTPFFYGALLIVTGLVLLIIVYRLFCWYRASYYRQKPWDKALRALRNTAQYTTPEKSPLFYSALTAIIKTYLHERYGYNLVDKTDEECIAFLATTDIPLPLQERLEKLLRASVMSKFASHHGAVAQMHEHSALVHDLITATIPRRTQ